MVVKNIKDLTEITDLIRTFNFSMKKRILIIYNIKTNDIIHILDLISLTENDMPNYKFFKVKGFDIMPILEKIIHSNTMNFEILQREINLQLSYAKMISLQCSENGFGYLLYDIVNQ